MVREASECLAGCDSSSVGAAGVGHLCLVELPASAFVSLSFSPFSFGLVCAAPQQAGCIGWMLLYNLKREETLFLNNHKAEDKTYPKVHTLAGVLICVSEMRAPTSRTPPRLTLFFSSLPPKGRTSIRVWSLGDHQTFTNFHSASTFLKENSVSEMRVPAS